MKGALACPDPSLEQGVGVLLESASVCRGAGYLCSERKNFQVARWPLDKGRLRVRVPLPEFADAETAKAYHAAAIEGILEWDNHPFPIVIYTGGFPLPMWDIGVVWSQGLTSGMAGHMRVMAQSDGKRMRYSTDGLAIVVPPPIPGLPPELEAAMRSSADELPVLVRIKAVAMHEMGHALGLGHSDSEADIMSPALRRGMRSASASARDLRTVEALYALPNGAQVQ